MGQYRPMFNITLEHEYFPSGKLSGVRFTPTSESEKLMNNANLVSRKRPDGLTIFFDRDYLDTLKLYAADADDPLKLNFECDVEHHQFQNFTDPDVFSSNRTLFFDSNNTESGALGKKYLHADEYVSANDLVENFTSVRAVNEQHKSFLQFSSSRALLFSAEQTAKNPNGKAELQHDDPVQREYLSKSLSSAGPGQRRQPSLGLISIQVSSSELEALENNPPHAFNDYYIKFKPRETYWKYYLVGDANRESAFIKDARDEIEFTDLGEEVLANGKTARVFLSSKPIPLRDRAKPKFQLLVMKNNRAKVLVSRLELASAKRINKTVVDKQELFVSEIYINF